MADARSGRESLKYLGAGVVALFLIVGFVWFVRGMMTAKSGKQQRQVQVVQIIRPPPPPPPDQPPPPPQEKTQEVLPKDTPEPSPKDEEPPPSQPLGIDADGAAGGDAFGLAARRGGSDLIGGNGTAAFAWYTNRLKDALLEKLSNDPCIKAKKFSASARISIESDGRIKDAKLATTTGSRDIDKCIEADALNFTFGEAPPLEMPQPITIKIISHS